MTAKRDLNVFEPVVCTLPTGDAARRRAEVAALVRRAQAVAETSCGVMLTYAGDDDTARALLDFVLFERRCCAQFTYQLRFAPDQSRMQLEVDGPAELAESVRAWLVA